MTSTLPEASIKDSILSNSHVPIQIICYSPGDLGILFYSEENHLIRTDKINIEEDSYIVTLREFSKKKSSIMIMEKGPVYKLLPNEKETLKRFTSNISEPRMIPKETILELLAF